MRVTPRSSRNRIEAAADGPVKVWVTASPTDGQANLAVCELIAKKLDLPKTAVAIVRGDSSRDKLVSVAGLSETEILVRLRG